MRRMEYGARRNEGVAADGNGGTSIFFFWIWRDGGRWETAEVAAKTGVGLDDDTAAEDDVGCAFDAGAAGDFVAGVLGGG